MGKKEDFNKKIAALDGENLTVTVKILFSIGENLAKREGYKKITELEAIYYYLIQKHHWTPSQVRSMKYDDLYFCMKEENL